MEDKGIAFISSKPIYPNNVYQNQAFKLEKGEKTESLPNLPMAANNSSGNTGGGITNKAFTGLKDERPNLPHTPPSSAPSTPPTLKSAMVGGSAQGATAATSTAAVPRPPPPKRGDSSVDFFLPNQKQKSMRRGEERGDRKSVSDSGPYRGMGKEELLRYSSQPFWRNLRYICVLIILTGWLALLIALVTIVLTYPPCQNAQSRDWWQKTVIYRIYVRSFFDTNGDGIGDLVGIQKQLDYLKYIGVNTISLSPIYMLANNSASDTHIVNHKAIDQVYGTMEEFKDLVNETHYRGMHIVLDFIPNHTSDEHPWFIQSAGKNKTSSSPPADNIRKNKYRTYYVWAKGRGGNHVQPPNNWISVTGCKAWENGGDNEHYFHQFTESQPDLNLRSQKVRDELEDILNFWLDHDVDGFYIRDSDYLFEDYDLRDEKMNDNITNDENGCPPYDAMEHEYTKGLSEVFDMFARWRFFLDEYGNKTDKYRILLADVDASIDHVISYYGHFNRDGVDLPLNKFSIEFNSSVSGSGVRQMVSQWMDRIRGESYWPNWMSGDDRNERLADRLGTDFAKPYMILAMLLPGTPYVYYGDEIGLNSVKLNDPIEPGSWKLPMRNPMPWNRRQHAGFCEQFCPKPWIKVRNDYESKGINVEDQREDPESLLNLFRNLTELRKGKPSFEYGDYVQVLDEDDHVFAFVREFDGEKGYLIVLNFANDTVTKYLAGAHGTIPGGAKADLVAGRNARHSKGSGVGLDPLTLNPYEGVVVSWDYKAKEP